MLRASMLCFALIFRPESWMFLRSHRNSFHKLKKEIFVELYSAYTDPQPRRLNSPPKDSLVTALNCSRPSFLGCFFLCFSPADMNRKENEYCLRITCFGWESRTSCSDLEMALTFLLVFSSRLLCSWSILRSCGISSSCWRIDSTCLHNFDPLFFSVHKISASKRWKEFLWEEQKRRLWHHNIYDAILFACGIKLEHQQWCQI